ncbi:MAG: helix-turn-helix transcriptional regulator [Prevotella sp.]|nr:helix-turn-helix transcriptional regulator [Prevotella sp.]
MNDSLNKKRRKEVGFLLQHERNCQELEQDALAQKLGERQDFISKIESSKRRIDVVELMDYAKALGFSITEIAWKIETYLSALSLLPLPNMNLLNKKIRVEVSWHENKFSALLKDIVPRTFELTADRFEELQIDVENGFDSYMKEMAADGNKVPWWLKKKKYEFEYNFLDARSLLNAYSPYISLAAISRASGINQNLLSQYAKGIKKARENQLKRIVNAIHIIGKELTAVAL